MAALEFTVAPIVEEGSLPFTLGAKIGTGAHAAVHEASASGDPARLLAVKIIDKSRLDAVAAMRIKREVEIHSELCDHPHIARLLSVHETSSAVYLVMERLTGGELFDRIVARKTLHEHEAATMLVGIFEAVAYLHSRGIAHRDLKPENLVFADGSADAKLKLIDFGLARRVDVDGTLQTPCGTPGFISTEMANLLPYRLSADAWALGVTLYTMLCGFPPFYAKDTVRLVQKIRRGNFTFPSPFWDAVSAEAKDLVSRLLCRDPNERLSASAALDHAWFVRHRPVPLPDSAERFVLASPHTLRLFSARSAREGAAQLNEALSLAIDSQRDDVLAAAPENGGLWKRRQEKRSSLAAAEASSVPADASDGGEARSRATSVEADEAADIRMLLREP